MEILGLTVAIVGTLLCAFIAGFICVVTIAIDQWSIDNIVGCIMSGFFSLFLLFCTYSIIVSNITIGLK